MERIRFVGTVVIEVDADLVEDISVAQDRISDFLFESIEGTSGSSEVTYSVSVDHQIFDKD